MTSPQHPYPSTKSINGLMDDDDGRTRNAKAQRRHREKRKAHLKTLEESVSLLTNQLEDARRQLSSAAYRSGMGGGPPLSPGGAKDFMALQHDNDYLRQENEQLRRQLFNYNNPIGGRHYQPGEEGKPEAYGQYGPGGGNGGGAPLGSPRADGGREGQQAQNGESFTPRGSRSRVMSSSSVSRAAAASPYVPPTSAFPTDPHAHALSQPGQRQMDRYPARYEPQVYGSGSGGGGSGSSNNHSPNIASASAPHNLPRSGLGYDHLDMYSSRPDDSTWGPDAGPPPFQASAYPVPYGDEQSGDWRSGQEQTH